MLKRTFSGILEGKNELTLTWSETRFVFEVASDIEPIGVGAREKHKIIFRGWLKIPEYAGKARSTNINVTACSVVPRIKADCET